MLVVDPVLGDFSPSAISAWDRRDPEPLTCIGGVRGGGGGREGKNRPDERLV
jgi:hypothetical protein